MKLGAVAGRLARAEVEPPPGMVWTDAIANRNWLIHQYDEIDRALTWVTLSRDLASWRVALVDTFRLAGVSLSTPPTLTTPSPSSEPLPFSPTFPFFPTPHPLPRPRRTQLPEQPQIPQNTPTAPRNRPQLPTRAQICPRSQ